MRIRTSTVVLALSLLLAGCGDGGAAGIETSQPPDLDDLTETYGCGTGFWIGNGDQTMALRIAFVGDGMPGRSVQLPDEDWQAVFVFGRDLYANWCDDVIDENEPTAVVVKEYPLTGGTLELRGDLPKPFEGGSVGVDAAGLQITLGDGTIVDLGDVSITNDSYGFFAG